MAFALTSPAFLSGQDMPSEYTSDGKNTSPPLQWSDVPAGTKSLVLIVEDPDAPDPKAPKMVYVHWVLYNIPPRAMLLNSGIPPGELPEGAREGKNNAGRAGYTGPKPPIGKHRYFFKLFALDIGLPDLEQPTRDVLERAMKEHIIGQTELVGLYQKA